MYQSPGVSRRPIRFEGGFGRAALVETIFATAPRSAGRPTSRSRAHRSQVDFIMLGLPAQFPFEQMELIGICSKAGDSTRDVQLWVHQPRAIRQVADRSGYCDIISAGQAGS